MITIGILEDDPAIQEQLLACLSHLSASVEEEIKPRVYGNADDFLDAPLCYDILLLDIFLGKDSRSGMDVARSVRAKDTDVLILFVTNLSQFALKGYSVNAFDFLVKPVKEEVFQEKVGKAVRRVCSLRSRFITWKTAGGLMRLKVSSIRYVEVYGHSLLFHTEEGDIEAGGSLTQVEKLLEGEPFCRCHAAYLVNLRQVGRVENGTVQVGQEKLPLSRHRKKEFMQALVECLQAEMLS